MEKVKNRSYQASFLQQFEVVVVVVIVSSSSSYFSIPQDQEISRDMKVWEKILKENI